MTCFEVLDEPRMRGTPAHALAGQRARGRLVDREEAGKPAKVSPRRLGRDGGDRNPQLASDDLRDPSGWHTLVPDRVKHGPGRRLFEGQAEQSRGVQPVDRVPAVCPVADMARDALLAGDVD